MTSRGRPRRLPGLETKSAQEVESAVRERCLKLLAQQPRTRAELERSLTRAGAPGEVVTEVLDRFAGVGLVDDTAYAQAYVRTGVGVRRRGTRSLRAELRGRGVTTEIIEQATAAVDEDAERQSALALASRRAAGLSRLPPEVARRRLAGRLLRRGFSGAVTSSVLAEVLTDRPDGDSADVIPNDLPADIAGFSELDDAEA